MTKTVPHLWGDYLPLQKQVASTMRENTRSRGADEALTDVLEKIASSISAAPDQALTPPSANLCDNRSAKYRHRLRIERMHARELSPTTFDTRLVDELAMRHTITCLRRAVEPMDWQLLEALAEGESFSSISKARGASVEGLKSRVSRLRRRLREGEMKDVLHEALAA
jgi:DNA-directed RNA polymerase specialized sigma24 family protein